MALAPDVILTTGGQSMELMVKATRTVPIVVAIVPDPVGSGLVARLSRPGGNATGFMRFAYSLIGKWLELLKQMAPGMTRAAVLRDPIVTAGIGQFAVIQAVAPSVGVEVSPIDTSNAAEIERAVSDFARESSCRTNREATGEMGQQITGIQAATLESVTAIKEISGTIERLSEISSTIAAAVEEQGGATQEISRNVQQAALGTQEVSSHITDVQRGASETGSASSEVLSAAQSLSSDSKRLKLEVGKFLNNVRAA